MSRGTNIEEVIKVVKNSGSILSVLKESLAVSRQSIPPTHLASLSSAPVQLEENEYSSQMTHFPIPHQPVSISLWSGLVPLLCMSMVAGLF